MKSRFDEKELWNPSHPNARSNGCILEHRLRASKALGKKLPNKSVVHHIGNDDLVLCQNQKYHLLLHKRMRARIATGHPTWIKCYICKQWGSPEEMDKKERHPRCHVKEVMAMKKMKETP